MLYLRIAQNSTQETCGNNRNENAEGIEGVALRDREKGDTQLGAIWAGRHLIEVEASHDALVWMKE